MATIRDFVNFNDKLVDLVEYIHQIFPDDKKIRLQKKLLTTAVKEFKKISALEYITGINKYNLSRKLLDKDADFFIQKSKEEKTSSDLDIGEKYHQLTEEQKETIWNVLHELYEDAKKLYPEHA